MSFDSLWGGYELGNGTSRMRKGVVTEPLRWRCIVINSGAIEHSAQDILFPCHLMRFQTHYQSYYPSQTYS